MVGLQMHQRGRFSYIDSTIKLGQGQTMPENKKSVQAIACTLGFCSRYGMSSNVDNGANDTPTIVGPVCAASTGDMLPTGKKEQLKMGAIKLRKVSTPWGL